MGLHLSVESGEVPASPGAGDEAQMPRRLQNLRLQNHIQQSLFAKSQKDVQYKIHATAPNTSPLLYNYTFYRSLRRRWVFLQHVDNRILVVIPFSLSVSFYHFERHLSEVAVETARFD